MKIFFWVIVFMPCLAIAGVEVKTVDWYKNHEVERNMVIEECDQNPGELINTPNWGRFRKRKKSYAKPTVMAVAA